MPFLFIQSLTCLKQLYWLCSRKI